MNISCRLGRHRALATERWNDGYYFSRCENCGIDLIRRRERWRPVPKGYRVVWKQRREGEIDWSEWTRRQRVIASYANGEWLPGTDSNHRPSD